MGETSRYCKAYPAEKFREFNGWTQQRETTTKVWFLHESYAVTEGIYPNEEVIFDATSDEWKQFCREKLQFNVPQWENEHASRSAE